MNEIKYISLNFFSRLLGLLTQSDIFICGKRIFPKFLFAPEIAGTSLAGILAFAEGYEPSSSIFKSSSENVDEDFSVPLKSRLKIYYIVMS